MTDVEVDLDGFVGARGVTIRAEFREDDDLLILKLRPTNPLQPEVKWINCRFDGFLDPKIKEDGLGEYVELQLQPHRHAEGIAGCQVCGK